MTKFTYGYRQAARAAKLTIPALIIIYGIPWLLWRQIGFESASLHPMLILCAVVAAYHGIISGLTTFALSIVPLVAVDMPARSSNEMFHLYSLQVLYWPAISALSVAFFGSVRDLREGELSTTRQKVERLRGEVTTVQKAADAAISALMRNEAAIAMRSNVTPLSVIKAFKRFGTSTKARFAEDLSRVICLVSPSAEFVLFSDSHEPVAASAIIRASTVDQMRRCISKASETGARVNPEIRQGVDLEAKTILAFEISREPRLVLCVTSTTEAEAEEIGEIVPELRDTIKQMVRSLKLRGRPKTVKKAIA